MWKVWLADIAAEFEYGRVAFEMKTIGRPIGQKDITIAAIAFALGNVHRGHDGRRPVGRAGPERRELGGAGVTPSSRGGVRMTAWLDPLDLCFRLHA